MKDIQEIMKEMNYLNNQIAATIDEEEEEEVVVAQQAPVPCNPCTGTGGESETTCNDLPNTGREVDFICRVFAPEGFRFAQENAIPNNPRIIFDTRCLHCFVEPCICNAANGQERFAVRVVGSIPFIANILLDPTDTQCTSANNVFFCCHDSVCVDTTICFGCTEVAALVACELIRRALEDDPCEAVGVTLDLTLMANRTRARINGTFILPDCSGNGGGTAAATAKK